MAGLPIRGAVLVRIMDDGEGLRGRVVEVGRIASIDLGAVSRRRAAPARKLAQAVETALSARIVAGAKTLAVRDFAMI